MKRALLVVAFAFLAAPASAVVTTAKTWAFVIGDTRISVLFPTEELRAMLDDPSSKDREEQHGSCPTRGKLISLAVALYRHKRKTEDGAAVAVPQEHAPVVRMLTADDITW